MILLIVVNVMCINMYINIYILNTNYLNLSSSYMSAALTSRGSANSVICTNPTIGPSYSSSLSLKDLETSILCFGDVGLFFFGWLTGSGSHPSVLHIRLLGFGNFIQVPG